jgi:hypothetical protein
VIGFTGTQKGMTDAQRSYVRTFLIRMQDKPYWMVHHGDCIGADHDFHRIVRRFGGMVYLHPPDKDVKRAFCDYDKSAEPKPYLERNHDIVDACDLLIATPGEPDEVLRSGTWSTIRYAEKLGRMRLVVNPDGRLNQDWTQTHEEG